MWSDSRRDPCLSRSIYMRRRVAQEPALGLHPGFIIIHPNGHYDWRYDPDCRSWWRKYRIEDIYDTNNFVSLVLSGNSVIIWSLYPLQSSGWNRGREEHCRSLALHWAKNSSRLTSHEFIHAAGPTGREPTVGHFLGPGTNTVEGYEVEDTCFNSAGRRVILVDTPGFNDPDRSDSQILKDIINWMERVLRYRRIPTAFNATMTVSHITTAD